MTRHVEAPHWFELARYAKANQLDMSGWLRQIGLRLALEDLWAIVSKDTGGEVESLSVSDLSQEDYEGWLGDFLKIRDAIYEHAIVPPNLCRYEYDTWSTSDLYTWHWQVPPIALTPRNEEVFGHLVHSAHWKELALRLGHAVDSSADIEDTEDFCDWIEEEYTYRGGHQLVAIDLSATNKQIVDAFSEWLSEQRSAEAPPSFAKPVTPDRLRSWARFQVLAYWDIQLWHQRQPAKLTQAQLAELLFPQEVVDANRLARTVPRHWRDVRSCYRAFRHQLAVEAGKVET